MSYNLEPMDPTDKGKTSMPFNPGSGQLMSTSTQFAQVDLLPRFNRIMPLSIGSQQMSSSDIHLSHGMFPASSPVTDGSYELAFRNKQSVQTGIPPNIQAPIAVRAGFLQSSSTDRSLVEKQSSVNTYVLPVNVGAQAQLSGSKKRPVKRERQLKFPIPMPVNLGSQQLLSAERRPSQIVPPPKPRTELFESVRLKMRESLAAALAMACNQQSKPQLAIKNSPEETDRRTLEIAEVGTEPVKLYPPTSTPVCESSSETLASNAHVMKGDEGHNVPSNAGPNETIGVNTEGRKHDMTDEKPMPLGFEDEGQFSSNTVTNDELLQVYGLCWADAENSETLVNQEPKRPKLVHQESNEVPKLAPEGTKDKPLQAPENLATKIEAELFKLFGGVNKKYKEKGRSLLFNLKDRNNPELRERVLSGDIAPERLCSMTAEELASKELSEWRLAKAEEFAQMVVLPDSDVDIRRLVRKTHKGEFQVEVEQDDSVSVEVGVGSNALTSFLMKANEEVQTQSKSDEGQVVSSSQENNNKASEGLKVSETVNSNDQNVSSNSDNLSEKAEFMQDFMVDELKDAKSLSPIVSLDEFMEALDSEPPFENISVDTVNDISESDAAEKNSDSLEPEMNAKSDSPGPKSDPALSSLASKFEPMQYSIEPKLYSGGTVSAGPHGNSAGSNTRETATGDTSTMGTTVEVDVIKTRPASELKSSSIHVEADNCIGHNTSKSETIWDGLIQLNISAVCTVAGSFRSGEKTSTNEWPKFLEIKGRVRLDAFEKFLQELPLSRSRATMLVEFCWKEGSDENGRLNLRETIDSYIVDERVGYAEPTPGVELYLCPPHTRTIEMLGRHLAEDHMKMIRSTVNGLIGVVVWRKLHVTISPRLPSHHKHGTSSKKQFSTNRQQQNMINSNSTPNRSSVPNPSRQPFLNPSEEPIDDIPPGFGPYSSKDNDDLPEFDFTHSRSKAAASTGNILQLPPPPARPVSQMRELIQKYGQGGYARKTWNDDDDIPEWQPDQQQPQPQSQQLPPPPQLSFPPQIQNYPQQTMQQQPFLVSQHLGQIPLHLQMPQAHAQQQQQQQMLMQQQQPLLQPQQQMLMQQQQQNVHLAQWWPPPSRGPADGGMGVGVALPMDGYIQPCNFGAQNGDAPFYGIPGPFGAAQTGMGWRPDAPRGRGP